MAEIESVSVLREQLDLTWQLAEIVLADVSEDECLWQPSTASWTVRRDSENRWVADWQDDPPDDMAQPTLAWIMWQAIWWWTVVCDQAEQKGTPNREDIFWPGAADGLAALRVLYRRWDAVLAAQASSEPDAGASVTFPFEDGRSLVRIAGWANVELTKNVSEMGLLRRLQQGPSGPPSPA